MGQHFNTSVLGLCGTSWVLPTTKLPKQKLLAVRILIHSTINYTRTTFTLIETGCLVKSFERVDENYFVSAWYLHVVSPVW